MKRSILIAFFTLILLCGAPTSLLLGQTTPPISGTVVETMNSGGYTYVCIDTGSDKIWAAAPQTPIATGARVNVPEGAPMSGFHSKTLNRTFEQINFVSAINPVSTEASAAVATASAGAAPLPASSCCPTSQSSGTNAPVCAAGSPCTSAASGTAETSMLPAGHPPMPHGNIAIGAASQPAITGIVKAEGGKTIAEIYAEKTAISGKEIKVRGKVVKFNAGIMKKNWLHIQDGTGDPGSNDLTVTTQDTVKVGDTVLVTGVLHLDKDFGFGYKYAIIVEDATIKTE